MHHLSLTQFYVRIAIYARESQFNYESQLAVVVRLFRCCRLLR